MYTIECNSSMSPNITDFLFVPDIIPNITNFYSFPNKFLFVFIRFVSSATRTQWSASDSRTPNITDFLFVFIRFVLSATRTQWSASDSRIVATKRCSNFSEANYTAP